MYTRSIPCHHNTIPHCTIPYHTTLYYTILHYTTILYHTRPQGTTGILLLGFYKTMYTRLGYRYLLLLTAIDDYLLPCYPLLCLLSPAAPCCNTVLDYTILLHYIILYPRDLRLRLLSRRRGVGKLLSPARQWSALLL